jgi:hypothetical protein
LLGWTQSRLSVEARISPSIISKFERHNLTTAPIISAVRSALEAAGVEFSNEGDPCVKAVEDGGEILHQANRAKRRGNYFSRRSPRSK